MNIFPAIHNLFRRVKALEADAAVSATLLATALAQSQVTRKLAASEDATTDRRAEIQALWDYFAPAGGVIVEIDPAARYRVVTVNSPASGDKSAGAYGLEPRSNCGLRGQGKTSVIEIHAGGTGWGVGCGISPYGMRTCTSDFGAAENVLLENFCIEASGQQAESGNLIAPVHSKGWVLRDIYAGQSLYHVLELDQVSDLTVDGLYMSGARDGGCEIQFDYGAVGPVNRPASITTRAIQRCRFRRVRNEVRPTGGNVRIVELAHETASMVIEDVTFEDCYFVGQAVANFACVDIAGLNTGGSIRDLNFIGCTFQVQHKDAFGFLMLQNSGRIFEGLRFERSRFSGIGTMLKAAGDSTPTTQLANDYRRGLVVRNCTFDLQAASMPGSAADFVLCTASQWSGVLIENNIFRKVGEFPAGWTASASSWVVRTGECRDTIVRNNRVVWPGTVNGSGNRFAIHCTCNLSDGLGTTRRMVVEDNTIQSDATTAFTYGVLAVFGGPLATRVYSVARNWGNGSSGAVNAGNNVVISGTP